jgi:hypothetical protein
MKQPRNVAAYKGIRPTYSVVASVQRCAVRAIIQDTIVERDKLKAQINTIKINFHVVVDRRPLGANVVTAPGSSPAIVLTTEAQSTDSERTALRRQCRRSFSRAMTGRKLNTEKSSAIADGRFLIRDLRQPSGKYSVSGSAGANEVGRGAKSCRARPVPSGQNRGVRSHEIAAAKRPFAARGKRPWAGAFSVREVHGGKESAKLKLSRSTSCGFEVNT